MPFVLPSLIDHYRSNKNGTLKYTGEVLRFTGEGKEVIAKVYGPTIEIMRARKHAVADRLHDLEKNGPDQIADLKRLVMAMAERLAIVAGHLGTLAERKEVRGS